MVYFLDHSVPNAQLVWLHYMHNKAAGKNVFIPY